MTDTQTTQNTSTYKWSNFEQCLKDFQATGRAAHHFPRLHQVSLNGGPRLPIRDAVKKMIETLNAEKGR